MLALNVSEVVLGKVIQLENNLLFRLSKIPKIDDPVSFFNHLGNQSIISLAEQIG